MLSEMKHSQPLQVRAEIAAESSGGVLSALIINADDWGRDAATTDRILVLVDGHGVVCQRDGFHGGFRGDLPRSRRLGKSIADCT